MIDEKKWIKEVDTKPPVHINCAGGYVFEKIMWNRNCSKDPKYWSRIDGTDRFLFRSDTAESWEFLIPSIENPIRNFNQIYLYFKNSAIFSEMAYKFKSFGSYTDAEKGTQEYDWFWDAEEDKCIDGVVIDGVRVNGRYYFMLNYSQIEAREKRADGSIAKLKSSTFPYLLDHQYYLINELEWWYVDELYSNIDKYKAWFPLATNEDYERIELQHGAIPKSRRLGVTYLAGNAVAAYDYIHTAGSYTVVGAYREEQYSTLRDEAIKATINFTNEHTPWVRRSEVVKRMDDEFEASFYDYLEDGTRVVKGYQSRLKFASLYNNVFKLVGKSLSKMLVEEAGVFADLITAFGISMSPLCRDGRINTGSITLFGTSGDMNKNSIGLSRMAYNPETYGLAAYDNIYDVGATGKASIFLDSLWYMDLKSDKKTVLNKLRDPYAKAFIEDTCENIVKGVDSNGNSLRFVAAIYWDIGYALCKEDQDAEITYITQSPRQLKEAFYVKESGGFDTATVREAKVQLRNDLESGNVVQHIGMFVERMDRTIAFDESNSYTPILTYNRTTDKLPGCWVVWGELPRGEIPPFRYMAGTDPIAKGYEEASSDNLHSLASTFILDTFTGLLVAEYTGRPPRVLDYNKNLLLGLRYFNCKTMYENNINGLKEYCQNSGQLHLLAEEPLIIKQRPGYKGGHTGAKGYHAATPENAAWLREEVATWLDELVDIGLDPVTNNPIMVKRYYTLKSMALLDELEQWNLKGNFDRISALMSLILYLIDGRRRFTARRDQDTVKEKSGFGKMVNNRLHGGQRYN